MDFLQPPDAHMRIDLCRVESATSLRCETFGSLPFFAQKTIHGPGPGQTPIIQDRRGFDLLAW